MLPSQDGKTSEQILRESINQLPLQTQLIIKAYATKFSLDYKDFNPVLWLSTALTWWETIKTKFAEVGITEDEASKLIVLELTKQEPWRKLFSDDPVYKAIMLEDSNNTIL